MKTIWIDLDNTPHIPFFRPIIDELKARGCHVRLTARDAYGVCDLADYYQLKYQRIGRHYGKSKIMKVIGSIIRGVQLLPTMFVDRPDLSVSHGSRSQLIAATLLGVPTVVIYDYEYAKALNSIQPTWLMMPDILPDSAISSHKSNVYKYPGIKEDVYVPNFCPDNSIKSKLGISENKLVITIRPPATEAHYHCHKSEELFEALIGYLVNKPDVQMVLLPRNGNQKTFISAMWPELLQSRKLIIPDQVVDGLNLIWFSDLVVSGGGTMNREAAALGVPVYSIFRGKTGAVDRYLSDSGRLVMLENAEDFATKIDFSRRNKGSQVRSKINVTLHGIVDKIIEAAEAAK